MSMQRDARTCGARVHARRRPKPVTVRPESGTCSDLRGPESLVRLGERTMDHILPHLHKRPGLLPSRDPESPDWRWR